MDQKETEGSLSDSERAQYLTQLGAIQKVLAVYDANENDASTASEAEELLRQMESVGTLPEEVLRQIGKTGADAPCTIM